jgi:ATP-binding cassette subfamily B protein
LALYQEKTILFFTVFLAPLSIVLETNVIPYALKMLIDNVINHSDVNNITNEIKQALYIGGGAWCTLMVIMWLQNWLQSIAIPRFEADIRMFLINYLMLHSYDYFSKQLSGSIVDKITDLPKSMESIRMILCRNGVSTFGVVTTTLIMIASINKVFFWILSIWIFTHLSITLYFVKIINKCSKKNAQTRGVLIGTVLDCITNIISVKLFARYNYEKKHIGDKQNREVESKTSLLNTTSVFQFCMDIAVTIMLVSTTYFLLLGWQQKIISVGDFVLIFNMIFAVMSQMRNLSYSLADLFHDVGIATQALKVVVKPYQINDRRDAKALKVNAGEIVFTNVTFTYNANNAIFNNENVIIKAGQKIGLVGFSGSGKSTFVNLILRFFDINYGVITIDGQDITKVTQDSLHENITVIPPDVSLFHRTIIENIRYGCIDATDEEVIQASKKAYCHDFIIQLPDQYNSLVGERGINISSGQRQRIAIARAILKNAPILILDEATSALDSVTEYYIQKGLDNFMKDRTTLVIAHRLSTLSKMDRILVFDNGRIIEDGTHEKLINAKGHYELMWKMQLNGFLPDKIC